MENSDLFINLVIVLIILTLIGLFGFVAAVVYDHRKERKKELQKRQTEHDKILNHPNRKYYMEADSGAHVYDTFVFQCIDSKTGKRTLHEHVVKDHRKKKAE
jgi:predicted histidine transporter YuiF (NhaC family)